jgi:hypothetical protein
MKTAVLVDSGYAGSARQTIPLVLEPARTTCRAVTREARAGRSGQARKPKRVVVPFSDSKPRLEPSDARIQVPKLVVWAGLELGFVMVLFASAFYLILLSVVAAGDL